MTGVVGPRLTDFIGTWTIQRVVTDHLGGPDAQFAGHATFQPEADCLIYREEGALVMQGHPPFKAERTYVWRQDDREIVIDFRDGRPFHRIDPNAATGRHWCDPDTYNVAYHFKEWPDWHSIWDVSGPKKAYQMITRYARDPL